MLLCFLLAAAAQAGLKNLERVTVSGSEYVRIAEWADSSGLSMKWNRKDADDFGFRRGGIAGFYG